MGPGAGPPATTAGTAGNVCRRCGTAYQAGADNTDGLCLACTARDAAELAAWLEARETDREDQAFALADQFDERWPR